jgi:hypothetical protein
MTSIAELSGYEGGKQITRVSVNDPVAGTSIHWTSPGTKATVITQEPLHQKGQSDCAISYTVSADTSQAAATGSNPAGLPKGVTGVFVKGMVKTSSVPDSAAKYHAQNQGYQTVTEDLGTTIIQGVEAHGIRTTMTIPVGAAGNDQPLVSTQENWISTGDNPKSLLMRHANNDPQFGKSTLELVNLNLDEPDSSVFQPPEGYEIVTQVMHQDPCPSGMTPPAQ